MKVRYAHSAVAVLSTFFTLSAFAADSQTLQVVDGSVGFLAIGKPSAIKIRGKGTPPKGEVQVAGKEVTGELTFDETSLNTGIDMRDHHMKEKYLQTDKYPTAKLKITKLVLPSDFSLNGFKADNVPMEGELTLHGVTKPVKGTANIAGNGGVATSHVAFGAQISDYSIEIPTYMGVKVADHVDIEADIVAKPAAEKPSAATTPATKGTKKK